MQQGERVNGRSEPGREPMGRKTRRRNDLELLAPRRDPGYASLLRNGAGSARVAACATAADALSESAPVRDRPASQATSVTRS